MSPSEVRAAVGTTYRSIARAGRLTDQYLGIGLLVHYGSTETTEAIEVSSLSAAHFSGRRPIGEPFDSAVGWLRELDSSVAEETAGCTSTSIGIGLYAPYASKDRSAPVEGLIVLKRGYYEGLGTKAP
jgi:hypothetical protein